MYVFTKYSSWKCKPTHSFRTLLYIIMKQQKNIVGLMPIHAKDEKEMKKEEWEERHYLKLTLKNVDAFLFLTSAYADMWLELDRTSTDHRIQSSTTSYGNKGC